MLVAGLFLTGTSRLPPKCMVQGSHKGLAPPLHWRGNYFACFQADFSRSFCLCLSESLQIQAPSPPFHLEVSNLFGQCSTTQRLVDSHLQVTKLDSRLNSRSSKKIFENQVLSSIICKLALSSFKSRKIMSLVDSACEK